MAIIVIPMILAGVFGKSPGWNLPNLLNLVPITVGFSLVAAGLTLMAKTITLFANLGQGTLAPWDPPQKLVVKGVYRHVRNPMISGVASILLGETLLLGSLPQFIWFLLFAAANAIYIPSSEEPGLLKRFGRDYEIYRTNVPRWIPRLTPWTPENSEP
jgi:protein-S-isoprenylcysteine O-methyltransferase Ste14